jgi:DNA polymerase-3 subunit delta
MKGKQQDVFSIIKEESTSLKCILLYGPNSYLVNDTYNKLCKSLFDENDVFAPPEFNIKEISKDSDIFYNEAKSLSFGGGRKYLKIDMDNSETPGPILDLLKDNLNEATLLIKAGNLSPRSSIRKYLEKLEDALIIPFYEDDFVSLKNFIKEKSDKRDFNFDDSAIHAIISMSGFERSQVRDALERIMLYYEFSENKNINDEKIKEILFDTSQNQISELCKHICLGETRLSQQIVDRLFLQGVTPPQFISALILHFQKLHVVKLSMASGQSIGNALKQIKPPIFFKEVNAFKTQIQNWNIAKIDRALEILIESDLLTKTKPGLGKSIIGNIVIRLATVAKKQPN